MDEVPSTPQSSAAHGAANPATDAGVTAGDGGQARSSVDSAADIRSLPRKRAWGRYVGFGIGVALLLAAVWAILRDRAALDAAVANLKGLPFYWHVLIVLMPIVNILIISEQFFQLFQTAPNEPAYANPPTRKEMCALFGASWLANYIPVRPGLFGRVAYHKLMNGVPIAKTIHIMFCGVACGGVAVAALLSACLLVGWIGTKGTGFQPWLTYFIVGFPLAIFPVIGILLRPFRAQWSFFAYACTVRYLDLLAWLIRYWVVFSIVGTQLSLPQAAAIAAVSQAAMLVPFVGNGLGVREVAVGIVASSLPPWFAVSGPVDTHVALTADLLNRAGEVIGAMIAGIAGFAWLYKYRGGGFRSFASGGKGKANTATD